MFKETQRHLFYISLVQSNEMAYLFMTTCLPNRMIFFDLSSTWCGDLFLTKKMCFPLISWSTKNENQIFPSSNCGYQFEVPAFNQERLLQGSYKVWKSRVASSNWMGIICPSWLAPPGTTPLYYIVPSPCTSLNYIVHSCNFMIPAPLFYEVNAPLLQVCYKP